MTLGLEWLAQRLEAISLPEAPEPGVCCVTGAKCMTVHRRHAIKPTFTDLDVLAAPASSRVGIAAWRVLNEPGLRRRSWLATTAGLQYLTRDALRAVVFSDITPPWMLYATISGHRHGALRTPLNLTDAERVVRWELQTVDLGDRVVVQDMWDRMCAVWQTGAVPRSALETLEIQSSAVRRAGVSTWTEYERWARAWRDDPRYQFLVWLLPPRPAKQKGGANGEGA